MADVTSGKKPPGEAFDDLFEDGIDDPEDAALDTAEGMKAWLLKNPDVLTELKRRIANPSPRTVSEEEMLAAINYVRRS